MTFLPIFTAYGRFTSFNYKSYWYPLEVRAQIQKFKSIIENNPNYESNNRPSNRIRYATLARTPTQIRQDGFPDSTKKSCFTFFMPHFFSVISVAQPIFPVRGPIYSFLLICCKI